MYFSTIGELIAIDGHGGFVWLAYSTTILVLMINYAAARLAIRKQERALRWRQEVAALQHKQTKQPMEQSDT